MHNHYIQTILLSPKNLISYLEVHNCTMTSRSNVDILTEPSIAATTTRSIACNRLNFFRHIYCGVGTSAVPITSSNLSQALLCKNLTRVSHTQSLLSPHSIIWCMQWEGTGSLPLHPGLTSPECPDTRISSDPTLDDGTIHSFLSCANWE